MSKGKVIVRHKVKDFNVWKPYFLGDGKRQREASFTRWQITRNVDDKNEIAIIFDCENLDKARPLLSDKSLAELMKKAGVVDQPTIFILEEHETGNL
jgi:hypothetical protein